MPRRHPALLPSAATSSFDAFMYERPLTSMELKERKRAREREREKGRKKIEKIDSIVNRGIFVSLN